MKQLVQDIMSKELYCANPGTPLSELARELLYRKHSGAPVVDTNYTLMGVVSLSDVAGQLAGVAPLRPELSELFQTIWGRKEGLRDLYEHGVDPPVADFMNTSVATVEPTTTVMEAAQTVLFTHVHRLVVTEGTRVVGIVTTVDIMRAMFEENKKAELELPEAPA